MNKYFTTGILLRILIFFFQNSYFWMAASNFLRKERIPTYSLFEEGFAFFLAEFQLFNNVRGVQSVLFYETHKIHFMANNFSIGNL